MELVMTFPYPDETWEEFADAQLDHEPTMAQRELKTRLASLPNG
jgi:hypothetical protein